MTDAPFPETLKRYRIIGVEDAETGLGIHAMEEPHGDWVDADAALAEIERLRTALVAARQFLPLDAPRGEEVNGWYNTVTLVDEALR